MDGLRITVAVLWGLFWIGWLSSAFTAKKTLRGAGARGLPLRGVAGLAAVLLIRISYIRSINHGALTFHDVAFNAIGVVLVAAGLGFAVWARVYLGRNWGMPMTQRADPELIDTGPYRLVRHPIYTGLIVAIVGTVLVTNLIGVVIIIVVIPYFLYASRVEEHNLTEVFPDAYPAYRARTKMLIPYLL